MEVTGDASLWPGLFDDQFMSQIIGLVLDGWEAFDKPVRNEREVPISRRFCCSLRQHRNRRLLPFRIEWESPELDLGSSEELGRIDLRFSHSPNPREDVYFAFECKRLNVVDSAGRRRSLAGKYVKDGMMRFVEGKYARNLDKGGMLGYVMDGDVAGAIGLVGESITERRVELRCRNGGLQPSSIRPLDSRVKETLHSLDSGRFMIHHLFLAIG